VISASLSEVKSDFTSFGKVRSESAL
jgi:hypothetical protein